jgi:phosphatidate phosphatase APP1
MDYSGKMRRVFLIVRGLLLALVAAFAPRALAGGEYKGFVVVYDGWGTPTSFAVSGRVLEDQDEKAPDKAASESVNIIENIKALESDEVRFADLQVNVGGTSYTATTDDDGNFKVQVKNLPVAAALKPGLVPVTVSVTKVPGRDTAKLKMREGKGNIYIYDDKVPFTAIVSDVDDTIVKTYVTDKRKLIGAVLLKNAHQLEPVVGASDAYQRAKSSGVTGYFYLSGSPQNFYLRIQAYLAHQNFPAGPLLLKNLGDDSMTQ